MRRLLLFTFLALGACQSQEPFGEPDIVGTIDSINIVDQRINYLVISPVATPAGYEKIQLSVSPGTDVTWFSTGDAVHSHQLVVRGMQVRAFSNGAIVDGTPPAVSVKRVEVSARRQQK